MSTADSLDILKDVEALNVEARDTLSRASDSASLSAWHHDYISRNGKITKLQKGLGQIKDIEARKQAVKAVHELRSSLDTAFEQRQEQIKADELAKKLAS